MLHNIADKIAIGISLGIEHIPSRFYRDHASDYTVLQMFNPFDKPYPLGSWPAKPSMRSMLECTFRHERRWFWADCVDPFVLSSVVEHLNSELQRHKSLVFATPMPSKNIGNVCYRRHGNVSVVVEATTVQVLDFKKWPDGRPSIEVSILFGELRCR